MTARPEWSRKRVYATLAAISVVGVALRLIALALEPPLHPDEYFQYLEPAWWHLTGVGLAAWEWDVGLRSWVLPFYNGAWMALLMRLGVRHGATIGWFIKAHWAVLNASLIAIAWRGGSSLTRQLEHSAAADSDGQLAPGGWRGGLIAAALCASSPILSGYAGHTLSELPSMLCLLAGLALTSELTEQDVHDAKQGHQRAATIGLLLSLSACLRIAAGPLVLVGPLWLLISGQKRLLPALLGGAVLPALGFAIADLLTWGTLAGSFVAYIKFNFIEGGASGFGTEPPSWYLGVLIEAAPLGLPMLALAAAIGVRAVWPFAGSAAFLVAFLSTQPHKEERFIIAFWPLLFIAVGGSMGAWLPAVRMALGRRAERSEHGSTGSARYWSWAARSLSPALSVLLLVVLFSEGARSFLNREESWLDQDRLTCQAWAGKQPDLTGLLIEEPIATGGSFWLGSRAPQLPFLRKHLSNPLFSHVLVRAGSKEHRSSRGAHFKEVHRVGHFRVMRRAPAPLPAKH